MTDRNTELLREEFEASCEAFKDKNAWFCWPKESADLKIADYFYQAASLRLSEALGVIEELREVISGNGVHHTGECYLNGNGIGCDTCKALTAAERFMKGEKI